jgi:hypothetical protein
VSALDLPTWVPAGVKLAAERALRVEAPSERCQALVQRLATDKRMRKVWRRLERHPVALQVRDIPFRLMTLESDIDGKELALFYTFITAYTLADVPLEVETVAERTARLRADLRAIARNKSLPQMRKLVAALARSLRDETHDSPPAVLQLAREARVSALGEHQLKDVDHRWVVARDQGDLRQRQYALALTDNIIWLYGEPMPSTVATVASVALDKNIELGRVKDWWELAHREQA